MTTPPRCPGCGRTLVRVGWLRPGFVTGNIHGGCHFYRVAGAEFQGQTLIAGTLTRTCANLHDLTPENTAYVAGRPEPRCKQCNRDRVRRWREEGNTASQTGNAVLPARAVRTGR